MRAAEQAKKVKEILANSTGVTKAAASRPEGREQGAEPDASISASTTSLRGIRKGPSANVLFGSHNSLNSNPDLTDEAEASRIGVNFESSGGKQTKLSHFSKNCPKKKLFQQNRKCVGFKCWHLFSAYVIIHVHMHTLCKCKSQHFRNNMVDISCEGVSNTCGPYMPTNFPI